MAMADMPNAAEEARSSIVCANAEPRSKSSAGPGPPAVAPSIVT